MLAFPDPATFQILPWKSADGTSARIICDIRTPHREPFEGDPRSCLQRQFRKLDEKGYSANVGPRIEYFYFGADSDPRFQSPTPLDYAGYFDLTSFDSSSDLRRVTTMMLERMSVPVEYTFHSSAPSQSAVELRYAEAVTAADNIMTARHVIRAVAYDHDMFASFMPKPLSDTVGSGMFLYSSLFDREGTNVFWAAKTSDSAGAEAHLSDLASHYVAGILKYAPEFTLITNPTVNSYKRIVPGGEAPAYATWGVKNRTALVRIPMHKPGKHQSTRIELRSPDPAANPYLAIAVMLGAGLRGIEEGLPLPEQMNAELLSLSPAELKSRGVVALPRTLGEAVERFRGSEAMRDILGDHIVDFLSDAKQREWEEYSSVVSEWELQKYYAGI